MSLRISRAELAQIVGGTVTPTGEKLGAAGVVYDSREIRGGELFVALPGEKEHGHTYLGIAYDRGAALFLVEDAGLLTSVPFPERLVVVKDSLRAFQDLAAWWRQRCNLPTVAVTGSVGKTTVKEMAAAILVHDSPGIYSLKSHNNHVGVPYTICRIGNEHRWTVLEMGMNHPGELTRLSAIGSPDAAVITCIAPAHIGFFNGVDGITAAKFEIFSGVRPGGTAILNRDDERLVKWAERYPTGLSTKWYGSGEGNDLRIGDVASRGLEGIAFTLSTPEETVAVTMSVLGRHNAHNAAAAVLAARAVRPTLSLAECARGLASFRAPLMRLNVTPLRDGRVVIDDSYNANPGSMAAAVRTAGDLVGPTIRVGLVLGDMLELGSESARYHKELGEIVASQQPQFLITVGTDAAHIGAAAMAGGVRTQQVASAAEALALVEREQFDILLVKASRGMKLDAIVAGLVNRIGAAVPGPGAENVTSHKT